jgi:transposase
MEAQPTLVELEPQPIEDSGPPPEGTAPSKPVFGQKPRKGKPVLAADEVGNPKLKSIDRSQISLKVFDLEHLIEPGHSARAISDLVGTLNLDRFLSAIRSQQGEKGRAANPPKMLVSVWLYAYSQGISSAREIERQMEYEPGLRWLCGDDPVNHHTLSDFRVNHKEALDELFKQLLAVMEGANLIDLSQVMHDGTKVRANAGVDTFRSKKTLQARLEQARQLVELMGDPCEDNPQARTRKQAAQERAARERLEKAVAAAAELEQLLKDKTAAEAEKARVSMTEPEARKMKHGDNAILPSYNVQLSTESSNKIILGMHLSQCSSDAQSLKPAVDVIEENMGRSPDQIVADGGFTNKANIIVLDARGIDFIGSLPDLEKKRTAGVAAAGIDAAFAGHFFIFQEQTGTLECPAGKALEYKSQSTKRGNKYHVYRAQGSDCRGCGFNKQCCPKNAEKGRSVAVLVQEDPIISNFREKMKSEQAQKIYKKRGPVAEFPNAWIKDKIGLRKYRLRGMIKAGIETMWACLAYNTKQWIRLSWNKQTALASAA